MSEELTLATVIEDWLTCSTPLERSVRFGRGHPYVRVGATQTVIGTDLLQEGVLAVRLPDGQILGNVDAWSWLPEEVRSVCLRQCVTLLPFRSLRQARVPLPTTVEDQGEDIEVVDREDTCPAGDGATFSGAALLRSRRTFLLLDSEKAPPSATKTLVPFLVRLPRGSRPASIAEARDLLVPDLARSARTKGLRVRRLGIWHFIPEREMVLSEPGAHLLERLRHKPHLLGYGIPRRLLSGTGRPWSERTVKKEYGQAYRTFRHDLREWEKARGELTAMLPVANGRLDRDRDGPNEWVIWADEVLSQARKKSFVRGKVTLSASSRSASIDLDGWHRVVRVEAARVFPAKGAVFTTEAPLDIHAATG